MPAIRRWLYYFAEVYRRLDSVAPREAPSADANCHSRATKMLATLKIAQDGEISDEIIAESKLPTMPARKTLALLGNGLVGNASMIMRRRLTRADENARRAYFPHQ